MQLLKLDIPLVREEIKWTEKLIKLSNKLVRETKKTPTLSTQRTRSGRQVMHKKLAADEVSDFVEKEASIESYEGNSPMTLQNQVEVVGDVPQTPMEEEQQPHHLTELLTVANDLGKISNLRPDPSDVSNIVEGTETAGLVRECMLCHKKVLGKILKLPQYR